MWISSHSSRINIIFSLSKYRKSRIFSFLWNFKKKSTSRIEKNNFFFDIKNENLKLTNLIEKSNIQIDYEKNHEFRDESHFQNEISVSTRKDVGILKNILKLEKKFEIESKKRNERREKIW